MTKLKLKRLFIAAGLVVTLITGIGLSIGTTESVAHATDPDPVCTITWQGILPYETCCWDTPTECYCMSACIFCIHF